MYSSFCVILRFQWTLWGKTTKVDRGEARSVAQKAGSEPKDTQVYRMSSEPAFASSGHFGEKTRKLTVVKRECGHVDIIALKEWR